MSGRNHGKTAFHLPSLAASPNLCGDGALVELFEGLASGVCVPPEAFRNR